MKKICFLVSNDLTNDPRVQKEAKFAAKSGFDVTVVCIKSKNTKAYDEKDGYKIIRVKINLYNFVVFIKKKILPKIKFNSKKSNQHSENLNNNPISNLFKKSYNSLQLLFLIFICRKLKWAARKVSADIYHANDLDTLYPANWAKSKNSKLVYDAHELWTEMNPNIFIFVKKYLICLEKKYITFADTVITVSGGISEELLKRYNLSQKPLIILNCPELSINKLSKKNENKIKIVLYQGRYDQNRGLEELVLASKYFDKNTQLWFRGYGVLDQELKKIANENNLISKKKIRFLEPITMNNLVNGCNGADIGVIPYKSTCLNNYYAMPNKLFEYMMGGLVIASNNLPEIKNIITTNQIGIIFDINNPKDIAEKIMQLTKNKNLSDMQKKTLILSKTKYNWSIEGQKLMEIYNKLI